MRPMSFGHLMEWILTEYHNEKSIFGVRKIVKYDPGKALPIFGEKVESPFGPAAGPNTQLAQNIAAAYVSGARFFELKTVQIMDGEELAKCISKPCITAHDEGYNCEWSTELTVPQAFDEYVKAYIAIKVIAQEFGLGDPDGFVFNMSVGYDLEGIRSEKIDTFIEQMKDAGNTDIFRECTDWIRSSQDRFKNLPEDFAERISPHVSRSITESTLHGCPPDEIERIATYLLTEKGLNTYIKCNPTLLGYEYARKRLDGLGFDYIAFDDHHFREDLQWADAVPMLERLKKLAAEKGLEFGVKLTNTFPVDVKAGELPSEEMYMSGRALFPLSLHVARLITEQFEGKMRISFSGGASIYNSRALFEAGIWPVTMATTILKPGGYERMSQICSEVVCSEPVPFSGVSPEALKEIENEIDNGILYRKPVKPFPERYIRKPLPLFDCFTAPCREGCPVHQDIPAYLKAMEEGKPEKALSIILDKNPLPFITGTICPHHCGDKCMRSHYEETLHIRDMKLLAAEEAYDKVLSGITVNKNTSSDRRIAVVGGGPAGLAAAAFLSRSGLPVTVFEKRDTAGGVVKHVIPEFRIASERIDRDIRICTAYGAQIKTCVEVSSLSDLKEQGYTDIIVAVGAWKSGRQPLEYGEAMDAAEFLEKAKKTPEKLKPGTDVVVLGGGNTAMDTARAAVRLPGKPHVRLVYRRTKRYMPADEEELQMALDDGVEFMELLAPVGLKDGVLTCDVCELGAPDSSGRRSPVKTGRQISIPADLVIAAVGERIDTALFEKIGAQIDDKGRPVVDENMMTTVEGVYAAGDCAGGPATVVEAIADACRSAAAIAGEHCCKGSEADGATAGDCCTGSGTGGATAGDCCTGSGTGGATAGDCCTGSGTGGATAGDCCTGSEAGGAYDEALYRERKGTVEIDLCASPDRRCLGCETICGACAEVCPNRANVVIHIPGCATAQILHVDGMCNECGNCAVFCPYDERPYRDKFTLFWSLEDFENSDNEGFLIKDDGSIMIRAGQNTVVTDRDSLKTAQDMTSLMIRTVLDYYSYLLC